MGVSQKKGWSQANAPYIIAATLAVIMFMLVAPEVNESDAMSPTIRDGDFLVVSKTSYSAKRGVPERGQIVILEKKAAEGVSDDNLIARVARSSRGTRRSQRQQGHDRRQRIYNGKRDKRRHGRYKCKTDKGRSVPFM